MEYIPKIVKEAGEKDQYGNQPYSVLFESGESVFFKAQKAPVVGQPEHGVITEEPKRNGSGTYKKFKRVSPDQQSFGDNRAHQRHEKNEDGMAWGNALNVAVLALHYGVAAEDLIDTAKEIFNARPGVVQTNISIDNGAGRAAFAEGLAKMAADTQKANTKDDDPGPSDADYQGDDDGEIDLDDIPF